jgi:SAM-dependent methyltransferase
MRQGYEKSARFYDLFDQKENIAFFLHYATAAGEILDVGAGTGRIAIPLARHGVTVWCVEPSPAMRREFERKLDAEPELRSRITLAAGTAASFTYPQTFPAALMSGSFDHLLDAEERLAALRNISRHLEMGGTLVFDVFLVLMRDAALHPADSVEVGGQTINRLIASRLLPSGRQETTLVFEVHEGERLIERIEETSLVGITHRAKLHQHLEAAGFEVTAEWGGYDFTPYSEGDALLILAAVKRQTV